MSTLELSSTTVSERLTDEYWRPLVDAVERVNEARADDPSIPRHPLGRFELDELVGRGGMGIVFRAHDPQLERTIALKLWSLEGDDAEQALLREAKLQAKVAHANVVTIYETGKIGADVYIAMEYVRGMDARRWMDEYQASWQVVLAMLLHAGRGLAAIHESGLVHADFKPENILVGVDGRVLVADFGVARVLDEHDYEPRVGSSGRGTRAYMAPERLEQRWTDARSDQFSFCVTLWECLHGVRPFAGGTAEGLLGAMAIGELRRGREVPEELEVVLRRGLALEPEERFSSMEELLRALILVPMRRQQVERSWVTVAGWVMVGAVAAVVGTFAVREQGHVDEDERRAISRSEEKIVEDRISSDQATTTEVENEPESVESEIVAHIADDEFEKAVDEWRSAQYASWVGGESSEDLSLMVARRLYLRAVKLTEGDPAAAIIAARYASTIASSVPLEPSVRDESVAAAETLETAALDLVFKLAAENGD